MAVDKGRVLQTAAGDPRHGPDVLLGKYGSDPISDVFSIVDAPVRLVAFGLSDDSVQVLRVWMPGSRMDRDGCGHLLPGGEVFEQALRLNQVPVVLTAEQNELVLDGVGDYRVMYDGDNRPDIHVVRITDRVVRVNDTVRGVQRD